MRQPAAGLVPSSIRVLELAHGTLSHTEVNAASGATDKDVLPFHSFLADHWLFSKTDFKVISSNSGIGRTAAFLSPTVSTSVYFPTRDCNLAGVASLIEISHIYSSIR